MMAKAIAGQRPVYIATAIVIVVAAGRAAGLVLLHDVMVFNGAVYYLQEYEGFSTEAILMLICAGASLIAAILAITAGNKNRRSALFRDRGETG